MIINNSIIESNYDTSVALGYFDGVHLGHMSVLKSMIKDSNDLLCPTVFTFSAMPSVKMSQEKPRNIFTIKDKIDMFSKIGVRQLYMVNFCDVANMEPDEFVKGILIEKLRAKKIYCGFNYMFGKGGHANIFDLREICKEFSIPVNMVNAVMENHRAISSTRIRESIENGDMIEARNMLGRFFSVSSLVVRGKGLGKKMGFPTINQEINHNLVVPKFGVYASITTVGQSKFYSVTNVGVKPTVGSSGPVIETWIMDYRGKDIYGERIKVEFIKFIREEKRFDSLELLKQAILEDAVEARVICKEIVEGGI